MTPLEAIAIASVSEAEPILPASAITNPAPEVITPPEVIVPLNVALPASLPSSVNIVMSLVLSVPLNIISVSFAAASIVMLPELVVILTAELPEDMLSAAILELVYVLSAETATCFIVPASFKIIWSASTIVTDEALVLPSTIFNSATVDVIPSKAFNSAAVDVTAVELRTNLPSPTIT